VRRGSECKALVLAAEPGGGVGRPPWLVEAPECRAPPGKVLTRTLSCPDIAALVADGPFGPAGLQSRLPDCRLPAVPRPLALAARCTPPTSPEKSGKELTVWQPAALPAGVAALAGAPTPTPSPPPRRHGQGEAMKML